MVVGELSCYVSFFLWYKYEIFINFINNYNIYENL